MATRYPPEFRRRAVELARLREKPITHLAADLGISDATLHGWLKQTDIDEGRSESLATVEAMLHLPAPRQPHRAPTVDPQWRGFRCRSARSPGPFGPAVRGGLPGIIRRMGTEQLRRKGEWSARPKKC